MILCPHKNHTNTKSVQQQWTWPPPLLFVYRIDSARPFFMSFRYTEIQMNELDSVPTHSCLLTICRLPTNHQPTTNWPPTDRPPTNHLPTTYRPLTNGPLPTTYGHLTYHLLPTYMYCPLTDHLLTTYRPHYWPPTDHLLTIYQPPTDHLLTTFLRCSLFMITHCLYVGGTKFSLGISVNLIVFVLFVCLFFWSCLFKDIFFLQTY